MLISKGKSRFVIAIPEIGIAIKFPLIHLVRAIRNFPRYIQQYHIWKRVTLQNRGLISPIGDVVRGIMENWSERCFYKRNRSPILQPTYFSLFGFVNIQKYGTPLKDVGFSIFNKLSEISRGDERIMLDAHHFVHSSNFTRNTEGRLLMHDYGFKLTQQIVELYGEQLHREYTFPPENN